MEMQPIYGNNNHLAGQFPSREDKAKLMMASAKKLQRLPPCKVCRAPASGFHYGANTCEACKTFFRRSLTHAYKKPCKNDGECVKNSCKGKINCATCRYKQCIEAGMDKQACKKGRYTFEKRLRDLKEISDIDSHSYDEFKDILSLCYVKEEKQAISNNFNVLSSLSLCEIVEKTFAESFPQLFELHEKLYIHKERIRLHLWRLGVKKVGNYMVIPSVQDRSPALFNLDHCRYSDNENAFLKADSVELLWQAMAIDLEKYIEQFAAFIKRVPGFTADLHIDDRLLLVKSVLFEQFSLTLFNCYDYKLEARILFNHHHNHLLLMPLKTLMAGFAGEEYYSINQRCQERIHRIDLTFGEVALLTVILVLSPDRAGLSNSNLVEKLQSHYINALRFALSRTHRDSDRCFHNCLMLLPELRECGISHWKQATSRLKAYNMTERLSPLVLSVLHTPPF